jgi:hypothetical protein
MHDGGIRRLACEGDMGKAAEARDFRVLKGRLDVEPAETVAIQAYGKLLVLEPGHRVGNRTHRAGLAEAVMVGHLQLEGLSSFGQIAIAVEVHVQCVPVDDKPDAEPGLCTEDHQAVAG